MTEDEAKTKACCGPPQVAAQMMGEDVMKRPANCAGSHCMAWRWGPIEEADPNEAHVLAKDHPVADPRFVGPTRKLRPASGYCGLASKP